MGRRRMWGEGCQALKIVCHQRHSHRRDVYTCLQETFGIRPPAPGVRLEALHLLPTKTEALAGEPTRTNNLRRDLFILLPANVPGGAGTPGDAAAPPTRALDGAQHFLSCHQFLIYWIQEKITTEGRGGGRRVDGREKESILGGENNL